MAKAVPRVIACLPCYNAEPFIKRTLSCLKQQTYPNFRVIISDDCSTDNTVSVIKSFISDDDRFHLIQQEQNLGWIDNVDFLLEKAANEGTYIFIMPHDDTIEKNYIQKLVTALEDNQAAVLAFSDMNFNDRDSSEVASYTVQEGIKDRINRVKILLKRKQLWWTAYRGMMRSDVVEKIIPSQKNLLGNNEYAADWYLLIRLAMHGEFVRIPDVLYTKYYHEKNKSHTFKHSHLNYFGNLVTVFVMMFRSPLTWNEMVKLQLKILEYATKRAIIMTGVYSLIKK